MSLVSLGYFAKLCDVRVPSLTYACKKGLVKRVDDGSRYGKVDLTDPINIAYMQRKDSRPNKHRRKNKKNGAKPVNTDPQKQTPPQPPPPEPELPADQLYENIDALSKLDADRLKVIEAIKTSQQKRKKERMDLVSRDLVRQVLGRLHTIDQHEFLTLGNKLAADIAAKCGVVDENITLEITGEIEKACYQVLSHKLRLANEFLEEIEAEGIE